MLHDHVVDRNGTVLEEVKEIITLPNFEANQFRKIEDPSTFWYKSEIGFYDFYVIPLAKKLKDCGVFGVTSDEYLDYAVKNREEWKVKGEEIVKRMLQKIDEDDIFIGNNNIMNSQSQD